MPLSGVGANNATYNRIMANNNNNVIYTNMVQLIGFIDGNNVFHNINQNLNQHIYRIVHPIPPTANIAAHDQVMPSNSMKITPTPMEMGPNNCNSLVGIYPYDADPNEGVDLGMSLELFEELRYVMPMLRTRDTHRNGRRHVSSRSRRSRGAARTRRYDWRSRQDAAERLKSKF